MEEEEVKEEAVEEALNLRPPAEGVLEEADEEEGRAEEEAEGVLEEADEEEGRAEEEQGVEETCFPLIVSNTSSS